MITRRRRRIRFNDPAAVDQEVQRLVADGCVCAGNWSLSQICTHLAQAIEASRSGFGFKAPIGYRIFGKPILKLILITRWIPAGVKLPAAALPPQGNLVDAANRLSQALATLEHHAGPWAEHPFFGRMSRDQYRKYHLVHAEHHLTFVHPITTSAQSK